MPEKLRKCRVGSGKDLAYFHGVFQYSEVIEPSPMIGGHNGGQIASPMAVVEMLDGSLRTVEVGDVSFIDRWKNGEIDFMPERRSEHGE